MSCSHHPATSIERFAIIPGNILIASPNAGWMKLAVQLVFAQDLMTSQQLAPLIASSEPAAYQVSASKTLETTVEERHGQLRIQAIIRNLSSQRNERVIAAQAHSDSGLITLLNQISKQIDTRAAEYSTKDDRALKALTAAVQSQNSAAQMQNLNEAIHLDPGFGAAYLTKIELLSRSAPQELSTAVAQAKTHASAFTPLDRARLHEIATRVANAQLDQQANASAALLRLAPNNLDALTSLAADRFLQRDAAAGITLLKHALEVSPGNGSIQMQMAQGLFETQQFAQAEKIFVSLDADISVLPNLATCILLEGDAPRANSVFATYVQRLQQMKDPLAPLANAGWLALSGRMPEAISSLESAQFAQPDLQSIGLSQIAVWHAAERNAAAAKQAAAQAAKLANAPVARVFATAADLIANAGLPPQQWQARVNASPLDNGAKQALLGYGFFLFGHFDEAAQTWQAILNASGNTDLRARAMLASSLEHTGKTAGLAKIAVQPFLPNLTGGDPYAAIPFTEMRRILRLK